MEAEWVAVDLDEILASFGRLNSMVDNVSREFLFKWTRQVVPIIPIAEMFG
jgi:hypothetical protein